MSYEPHMPVRIARPSADLDVAETFWVSGVGLEVQWRTEGEVEGGHQLLMVGPAGGAWHRNPYWDRWGQTYADPDGHLLVLSHRTWP